MSTLRYVFGGYGRQIVQALAEVNKENRSCGFAGIENQLGRLSLGIRPVLVGSKENDC